MHCGKRPAVKRSQVAVQESTATILRPKSGEPTVRAGDPCSEKAYARGSLGVWPHYKNTGCTSHQQIEVGCSLKHNAVMSKNSALQARPDPSFPLQGLGGWDFVWGQSREGKVSTHRLFGAGPSDMGNFNTPDPRFLVDNQLCETLARPNFEQYLTNILDDDQLLTPKQRR